MKILNKIINNNKMFTKCEGCTHICDILNIVTSLLSLPLRALIYCILLNIKVQILKHLKITLFRKSK